MLPFRVVVKPYLRQISTARTRIPILFITLIQPFLSDVYALSAQRTTPIYFLSSLAHSFHRDGGCRGNPSPAAKPFHVSTTYLFYFHILAHSFALFCTHKNTTPLFSIVSASSPKTRVGGTVSWLGRSEATIPSEQSPAAPTCGVTITSHLFGLRTIAANGLGATIRKGTRNL